MISSSQQHRSRWISLSPMVLVVDGTRANVVNNQVVVVTRKDSGTKVTGLDNLSEAESFALAGGSVPVGKYTRNRNYEYECSSEGG